ncbi:MAG: glycosyltransferase family A protein, partial [Chlamydiota bacterium]
MAAVSPRVSIIITCHNLGRYLHEALVSVHRQTLQEYEIIVVDDASTEKGTVELLARLDMPRTRLIRVEKRRTSAARNFGIREARGPYICCLDADDLLEPTYL